VPPDPLSLAVRQTKLDEAALLLSKHADYGPKNIADAPGGPLMGLAVRLHDKVARLAHLLTSDADPNHESLHDTFQDLANYGTIGQLVLAGYWPGVGAVEPPAVEVEVEDDGFVTIVPPPVSPYVRDPFVGHNED
jgi:hypothetical protein